MRKKETKTCLTCICREICPLRGKPCDRYNDAELFRGTLKMLSPITDWDVIFRTLDKNRKLNKGE